MSDLIKQPTPSDSLDCPKASQKPIIEKLPVHEAQIGESLTIRRALPHAERRMIGAWCFFDHFGPLNLKQSGLNIAPHPHMGLQTFTWTLHGEILHRDSLGSEQIIHPGQVNLMTSGFGISHSEESLPDSILHGVQLWIALPDNQRNKAADFKHYKNVPTFKQNNATLYLLAGECGDIKSEVKVYSPLMGIAIKADEDTEIVLPLNPTFEYGILPLIGNIAIDDNETDENNLLYLGCGRKTLTISLKKGAYALMLGGVPFNEEILMWWNFVARTQEELIQGVYDWENSDRFGEVHGYQGGRLAAPKMGV